MAYLPRPQDQLSSYFTELLTDEEGNHLPTATGVLPEPTARSKAASNIPSTQPTKAAPVIAPIPPKLQDEYMRVKAVPQAQTVDTTEAIYQLQQQKLQQLLQNIPLAQEQLDTETNDVTSSEIAEPMAMTEAAIIEASQAIAASAPLEQQALSSEWLENGRPCWAQSHFDILLVNVQGLTLAVPLAALGQIYPIDEQLTPLFGQSEWFMGLQKTPVSTLKAVNTAQYVMPERYQPEQKKDLNYIVEINGLGWALAVDGVEQPINIDPDNIRWRPKRDTRPWMAGTVKDHMCVLVDIPTLGELLNAHLAPKSTR